MLNLNHKEMTEIISKYKEIVSSIDEMISNAPVKKEYLADKIGVGRNAFYKKRKENNFSLKEVEILIKELSKFQTS